ALGPRGAGNQFHGKRGHTCLRDLPHDLDRTQGTQETHEHLATPHLFQVVTAIYVVRPVTEDLHDDVSLAEHLGSGSNNLCPLLGELCIRITGFHACAGFDDDVETCLRQARNYHGDQRYATLARIGFSWHTNDHDRFLRLMDKDTGSKRS